MGWHSSIARLFISRNASPTDGMYTLLGPHPVALIIGSFSLDTTGQVALVVLLGTLLLSSSVRQRNTTLINLLVVTVLCSVPPALLFYTHQYMNPHPPVGLCLSQAILKQGSDPMFVVASLALVIEFLQGTGLVIAKFMTKEYMSTPVLVAMPYMTFILFATLSAGIGGSHLHKVVHKRNSTFCSVDVTPFTRGQQAFIVVVVLITISLEAYTIVKLRRTWHGVKRAKSSTLFTLSQALRIIGFTILQLNYVILCAIGFYFSSVATHVIPMVYEALMPLGTFLIFGTTADCLSAWMCCFKRRKSSAAPDTNSILRGVDSGRPRTGPDTQKPLPVVIPIDFRLSLIPGYKTPSDFLTIDDRSVVPSATRSVVSEAFTIRSVLRSSRSMKTSFVQCSGDGLSMASAGDQPRSLLSVSKSPSGMKPPPVLRRGEGTAPMPSGVHSPPSPNPQVDRPFFLTLSLPPPGLSLELDFGM